MAFKNQLTPLTKGGSTTAHKGKQAMPPQALSTHNNVSASGSGKPNATLNDYAKATPAAQPTPPSSDGLGSGTWPGIGQ